MSSMLDISQLEGVQDFSLDHLSQIKLTSMEKLSNGPSLKSSANQLTPDRRTSTEDESLNANVGSPESDVTLPYSPRPEPVDSRRASVDSFTPPLLEVIESGSESFAERIAAVDAAIESAQQAKKLQNENKRNTRAHRRHSEYSRPLAASETVFRPHYVA